MTQTAEEGIVPTYTSAIVGDSTYSIGTFSLVKTIRLMSLLGRLAEDLKVGNLVDLWTRPGALLDEDEERPGFVSQIIHIIPNALLDGSPTIYELLGLIVTPNGKLRNLEDTGEDVTKHLRAVGRTIAYEATNDQVIHLLVCGVNAVGVESFLAHRGLIGSLFRSALTNTPAQRTGG